MSVNVREGLLEKEVVRLADLRKRRFEARQMRLMIRVGFEAARVSTTVDAKREVDVFLWFWNVVALRNEFSRTVGSFLQWEKRVVR